MLNPSSYVDLVLVSAANDVLIGHSKRVHTASSLTLQHVHTLQRLQPPHLQYTHTHTHKCKINKYIIRRPNVETGMFRVRKMVQISRFNI